MVLGPSEYSVAQQMLHHNAGQVSSASTQHLGAEPVGLVAHQAHSLAPMCPAQVAIATMRGYESFPPKIIEHYFLELK